MQAVNNLSITLRYVRDYANNKAHGAWTYVQKLSWTVVALKVLASTVLDAILQMYAHIVSTVV